MTENGAGDIVARITDSTFEGNDNTQVELEEEDEGGHDVRITDSTIVGDGEDSLDVIEDGDGTSLVVIDGGTIDPAPVSSGVTSTPTVQPNRTRALLM